MKISWRRVKHERLGKLENEGGRGRKLSGAIRHDESSPQLSRMQFSSRRTHTCIFKSITGDAEGRSVRRRRFVDFCVGTTESTPYHKRQVKSWTTLGRQTQAHRGHTGTLSHRNKRRAFFRRGIFFCARRRRISSARSGRNTWSKDV